MSDNDIIPEGFKMTDVGMIPEEWTIGEIAEVAELVMGQSPPGDTYNEIGQGIPFLQGKAEFGSVSPRHIKYTKKPMKIAPIGSILISVRAPVGDVNIANINYCIGRGLASISMKSGDNNFLFYLMHHMKGDIEKEGTGSTFKAINKSKLETFRIPLPPLPEQKKIAAVLSTVQNAKERTEAVISAARELKKSLMKYLFTYGPVPMKDAESVPLKETEIGMVPEGWEIRIASEVFTRVADGTHDTPKKLRQGIPLVTSKLIRNGRILLEQADYFISEEDHETVSVRSGVDEWDVLYTMIGTIGNIAIVRPEYAPFSIKNVGLFKSHGDRLLSEYVAYWFQSSRAQKFAIDRTSGTTQSYVPLGFLRKYPIPMPPSIELKQIADILSTVDQKIEAEEGRKEALEQLFRTLLSNLMTGRIRVNQLEIGGEPDAADN